MNEVKNEFSTIDDDAAVRRWKALFAMSYLVLINSTSLTFNPYLPTYLPINLCTNVPISILIVIDY